MKPTVQTIAQAWHAAVICEETRSDELRKLIPLFDQTVREYLQSQTVPPTVDPVALSQYFHAKHNLTAHTYEKNTQLR